MPVRGSAGTEGKGMSASGGRGGGGGRRGRVPPAFPAARVRGGLAGCAGSAARSPPLCCPCGARCPGTAGVGLAVRGE